jgi:hypothetical protein
MDKHRPASNANAKDILNVFIFFFFFLSSSRRMMIIAVNVKVYP